MSKRFLIGLCLAFWLLLPMLGLADTTIIGGPTRVIDADTLEVKGEGVRLQGIDAPETRQMCERGSGALYPCGQAATRALQERIGGGNVSCAIDAQRDRCGRALGVCSVRREDPAKAYMRDGDARRRDVDHQWGRPRAAVC